MGRVIGNACENAKFALKEDFSTRNCDFLSIIAKCVIIATFLFMSCFIPFFVWVAFVASILFALTQFNGRSIYYLVFLLPLMGIFKKDSSSLYLLAYILCAVLLMFAAKLIYEVFIKRTKKINWWFSIVFVITLIYFMMPFTFPDFSTMFSLILGLCLVFACYYYKEDLDAKELGLIFIFGVLCSIFIGLFYDLSPRLQSLVPIFYAYGLERFSGAYTNPNILAGEMMFALAIIYTLVINKQIKLIHYPIIIIFQIALLFSMSKSGLIIFAVVTFLFIVLYVIKNHRWKDFINPLIVLASIGVIILIFKDRFFISFGRITAAIKENPIINEGSSSSGSSVVVDIEELTTGRSTIWTSYVDAIFSSFKTAMFGYGVGAPYIGEYAGFSEWCPHNTYLQCLYFVGIFGVMLMVALLITSNGIKKFKAINWYNFIPIIALGLYLFSVEFFSFRLAIYLIVFLYLLVNNKELKNQNSKPQEVDIKIPKIIHYIWLGGASLPKVAEDCIQSWKNLCPDYEIKRWDESNLNLDCCKYCREAYDAKKYAFASDVLRFDILSKEGGIYLDIDVKLLKPLDNLLSNDTFVGFEYNDAIAPGLVIGSVKGGRLVNDLYSSYKDDKFILDDGTFNLETICTRSTNYLLDKGLRLDNTKQKIDEIVVYPTEYFCPLSPITSKKEITANTYAIHLYYSSWYNKKATFKKNTKRLLNFITNGWFGSILYNVKKRRGCGGCVKHSNANIQ